MFVELPKVAIEMQILLKLSIRNRQLESTILKVRTLNVSRKRTSNRKPRIDEEKKKKEKEKDKKTQRGIPIVVLLFS